MKPIFKHGLSLVVLMSLVACSGTKPHQATGDFSYLESAKLRTWQDLSEQNMLTSDTYAIPNEDYTGAIGDKVSILPPVQLLELIPAGRYRSSASQAAFILPSTISPSDLNAMMRSVFSKESIAANYSGEQSIETGWVKLFDEKNSVQARYQITPLADGRHSGIEVKLLEARGDAGSYTPTDQEKERLNALMANRFLLHFDHYIRNLAEQEAKAQLANINIDIGTDRSGNAVIIARSSYEQFWNRLPSIIEPLGFTVEASNRSQGMVEVAYSEPKDTLWQQLNIEPISLDNRKYKLQLGDLGNRTSINVLDHAGKPVEDHSLLSLSLALIASMEQLSGQ